MFVKIQNNILTDWADWEFNGSTFVDIDYDYYNQNSDKFIIQNNKIVDISKTQKYQTKQRIKEIEKELDKLDELFYQASQSPIVFENRQYKFDWSTLYQGILDSGILPAKIWDMSELEINAVIMDKEKLQELQNVLLEAQETAFQTRKEARSILLVEKENLENSLRGMNE